MQGCVGGTGKWGKGYCKGAWNAQGDVSSHTSCSGSVSYPAVGYYVFIWEGRNKTDFSSQDRGLSDDGVHIYCCVVLFSIEHWCALKHNLHTYALSSQTCLHKTAIQDTSTPILYKLYHTFTVSFTNTLTGVQTHIIVCQSSSTWTGSESTRWLQRKLENNPSTISP